MTNSINISPASLQTTSSDFLKMLNVPSAIHGNFSNLLYEEIEFGDLYTSAKQFLVKLRQILESEFLENKLQTSSPAFNNIQNINSIIAYNRILRKIIKNNINILNTQKELILLKNRFEKELNNFLMRKMFLTMIHLDGTVLIDLTSDNLEKYFEKVFQGKTVPFNRSTNALQIKFDPDIKDAFTEIINKRYKHERILNRRSMKSSFYWKNKRGRKIGASEGKNRGRISEGYFFYGINKKFNQKIIPIKSELFFNYNTQRKGDYNPGSQLQENIALIASYIDTENIPEAVKGDFTIILTDLGIKLQLALKGGQDSVWGSIFPYIQIAEIIQALDQNKIRNIEEEIFNDFMEILSKNSRSGELFTKKILQEIIKKGGQGLFKA